LIKIIENVIWRYIELDIFQEFLSKVLLVISNLFEKNEKNKKNLPLFNNNYVSATEPINEDEEKEIIHSQKNALIIELMFLILQMKSLEINDKFMPILVNLYQKILKMTKKENKGLLKLLAIMGDPKDIINIYKDQNPMNIKRKEKSLEGNNSKMKKNISVKDLESDEIDETQRKSTKNSPKNSTKNPQKSKRKLENKSSINLDTEAEDETFQENSIEKEIKEKKTKKTSKIKKKSEFLIEENFSAVKPLDDDDETLNEEELEIMRKYGLSLKPKKKTTQKQSKSNISHKENTKSLKNLKQDSIIEIKQEKKQLRKKKKPANFTSIMQKSEDLLENLFESLNFEFCSIEDYEERDLESINIIKKKHEHFLKLLFSKYANSTNQSGVRKSESFRPSDEALQVVSMSDIRKMFGDFEFDDFIKKDVVEFIFSKLNTSVLGEPRKKALNYENFLNFLILISKFIFLKAPFDMGEAPIGVLLEELMNLMWKLAVQKNDKQILLLFSNKNKQNIKLQILNNILKEDPESELPDVLNNKNRGNFEKNSRGSKKLRKKTLIFNMSCQM